MLLRSWRGRRSMEQAARDLGSQSVPADSQAPGAEFHFLTGRDYWFMTAFCAATLLRHAGSPLRIVLDDDGTLEDEHLRTLRLLLGDVVVHDAASIESMLDRALPAGCHPILRARRAEYPHLRKLTDVHAGQQGARVVLDSDMLFWRRPDALLDWIAKPTGCLCMTDCQDSYGYSFGLMEELAGAPVPRRLNVGIVGMDSATIDWQAVERWAGEMLRREGSSYYQEQALTAMLMAGHEARFLDAEDYVVCPKAQEAAHPHAVLHHYVAESRHAYLQTAWRRALADLRL